MKRVSETTVAVLSRFVLSPQWRGVAAFACTQAERVKARRALLSLTRAGILQQRLNDGRAEWNLDRSRIEQAARIIAAHTETQPA